MDKAHILYLVKSALSSAELDQYRDDITEEIAFVLWTFRAEFSVFKTFANIELPQIKENELIRFNSFLRIEKDPTSEDVFLPDTDKLIKKAKQKVGKLRPYLGYMLLLDRENNHVSEAATRIGSQHYVTFQHTSHSHLKLGDRVTIQVDGVNREFEVEEIDTVMDLILLKSRTDLTQFRPVIDALYSSQVYIQLGFAAYEQSQEPLSVNVGGISSAQPDSHLHARGSTPSCPEESGGPVFDFLTGNLIGVCLGNQTLSGSNLMRSSILPITNIQARYHRRLEI